MHKVKVACKINGNPFELEAYPMERLLDVLRNHARLTGTKEGCGEGECGACSIFINGELVNSCLVPIAQACGTEIETIESTDGGNPILARLRESFVQFGGAQCGICTPGMLMASWNLLRKNKNPSREQIQEALGGNLCRCTGYVKIIDAIERAAQS